ncbi:MAG: tRNA (adenosine(37)-N6)-threonylcarbamoyltransferase complex transferase subunit TsaD [Actinobacteria bacterium]|nr:tRNA (adenosine(37)-N6)-threonylcarbamoyltransferase complex transferase subunit TsaD [Actinomycetota bacterium]
MSIFKEVDAKDNIYILGIETSCDDTCASIVGNGSEILSNVVSSQNEIHRKYGGVVPEVASRRHIEMIDIVIGEALEKAGKNLKEIDAVSVTNRPGLIGSLLVGVGAAKAISYAMKIPLIAVNHLEAHLYSNLLENQGMTGDFLGLIVSGGHSSLYLVDGEWKISELGHTVDDAAGEAFDKIARYLGLGYPGGPIIDKMSKEGNEEAIDFPRPMIDSGDFNFSFSGLKTALIYRTKKNRDLLDKNNTADLVASFQKAVVDVLVHKTISAARQSGVDQVLVSGGVAANSRLREELIKKGEENNIKIYIPSLHLCMDNAAMVGCLGYYRYIRGFISDIEIDVSSRSDF